MATCMVALAVVALASTACFQQSNTYPVEIFKEMHYSQAQRPQEPPRLPAEQGLVAFAASGGADAVLDMSARLATAREYHSARGADLYRVNCAVCHGVNGAGDGAAAVALKSGGSYWAATKDSPYNCGGRADCPPNLQNSVKVFTPDNTFAFVRAGGTVMPRFNALLSDEDIWDIVGYLFDAELGIASKN